MEIKIYQINRERDNNNLMFMNLKFLEKKELVKCLLIEVEGTLNKENTGGTYNE